jgi:hypothetical protein
MTDFQAKCLRLWDQGKDTHQIAVELSRTTNPVREQQVYSALNSARVERRVFAMESAS